MFKPKIVEKTNAHGGALSQHSRGIFISFEGPEACGKTTQIRQLAAHLEREGRAVFVTREPGGTRIGESIRSIVLKKGGNLDMCPETELLLFVASRAQLVREVIVPELEKGTCVLCDRFLDSTTVYQGAARCLEASVVDFINRFAVGNVLPDWTILLDIPPEVSRARIQGREDPIPDRIELESGDFYQRAREGYLALAKAFPNRFFVIDGTQSEKITEDIIWKELERKFG